MEIDLHGYHPAEIVFNGVLSKILQQVWEMGESDLTLIHGHGRNRGITPLDCRQLGCTPIGLKRNSNPTRKQLDCF